MTDIPALVNHDNTIRFLENAFRNIDLPPLAVPDIKDITTGLEAFCRALIASRDGGLTERLAELDQKNVELSTRLRTIYWLDAKNDGATDKEAHVEADARLNAPLSLGAWK